MKTECRLSCARPPSNVIADTAADARPTSPTSYRRAPTIQNSIPSAALATVENINATALRATSTAVCTLAVTPASYVWRPEQALGPAWLSTPAHEPSGQSSATSRGGAGPAQRDGTAWYRPVARLLNEPRALTVLRCGAG